MAAKQEKSRSHPGTENAHPEAAPLMPDVSFQAKDVAAVNPSTNAGRRSIPWRTILYVTLAVLFTATLALRFVFEPYKIPSGAMLPSLEIGDHIFANTLAYSSETPRRGDLIVFQSPETEPAQVFVKHVLGLPGDRLEFENGHPILNGTPLERCWIGTVDLGADSASVSLKAELYVEFIDDVAYWTSYDRGMQGDRQGPYEVPAGELWVVGDNRHNSYDSRAWNQGRGAGVPFELVEGRVLSIWLPFSRSQPVEHMPVKTQRLDAEQENKLRECLDGHRGETR